MRRPATFSSPPAPAAFLLLGCSTVAIAVVAARAAEPTPARCPVPIVTPASRAAGVAPSSDEIDELPSSAPEAILGDRLFFETRFAQFFFAHGSTDVNAPLAAGDPVVDEIVVADGPALPGPFRGRSMNCRQCHLGDDFLPERPLRGRTYGDFSRRSPVTHRDDGLRVTPRNAPQMIDLTLPRAVPRLFHFDGEFVTAEDVIVETLTGRNLGWLPRETATAVAHVARVVREDAGVFPRLVTYPGGRGVPYRVAFAGTAPDLPAHLRLPARYRLDVATATDAEIVAAVARVVHAYMRSLRFGTENTGRALASPYDVFLEKNDLPPTPAVGEAPEAYAARLLGLVERRRERLLWVTPADGRFELHRQPFRFGPQELAGLELFFARPVKGRSAHIGNCVACHPPPRFTDDDLHNTGASQVEYDAMFGAGAFAALAVPDLAARNADVDAYLPATPRHPDATNRFRSVPDAARPGHADLGVWSVFANPDFPKPQAAIAAMVCSQLALGADRCTPEAVLPLTLGRFKTPTIRDLGQSDPYLHSGALDTIEAMLRFYRSTADLARAGRLRNGAPELADVRLDASDEAPLAAFLRALNEDYH